MAQPYTARQLDFFKNTLKILESAIFETVLSEGDTETFPQETLVASTTAVLESDSAVYQDTDSVKSSYFSVLPASTDVPPAITHVQPAKQTPSSVAIVVPVPAEVKAQTSSAFFHNLPWHQISSSVTVHVSTKNTLDAPADNQAEEETTISSVLAVPNAKKCADFFRVLPWKAGRTSVIAKVQAIADSVPSLISDITVGSTNTDIVDTTATLDVSADTVIAKAILVDTKALPAIKSCASFFRSLPWHGDVLAPSTADIVDSGDIVVHAPPLVITAVNSNAISIEAASLTTIDPNIKKTSAGFFHTLPWQGQKESIGETNIITVMNNDDFVAIANLATQTALQAAQRSSFDHDVIPTQVAGPKTASRFFQTLPW